LTLTLWITASIHGAEATNAISAGPNTNVTATGTVATSDAQRGTLDAIFNRDLPDAIGQSRINFQWRPRYEYADTETSKPSQAFTMRTVFGLTSAELYGFQGMIEGLNLSTLGNRDSYNAGDNGGSAGAETTGDS